MRLSNNFRLVIATQDIIGKQLLYKRSNVVTKKLLNRASEIRINWPRLDKRALGISQERINYYEDIEQLMLSGGY